MFVRRFMLAFAPLLLMTLPQSASAVDNPVLTYCKDDVERLCAGVQMGGGRILQCLKSHKEEMSVGCAQGLMKLKKNTGK